ncbi:MAG: ABC transporter permease [Candidatus Coproplasma sp.]
MIGLLSQIRRNVKMFFKDKGMFFTSLITPVILLVLYVTFLANVYRDSFSSALNGVPCPDSLISGVVAGQLMSSLLAVSCITVAFCSNMLIVQDKVTGAKNDLLMSPAKRSMHAVAYYIATLVSTLLISFVALGLCLVYVALSGWYMSVGDVFLCILDVVLLTMFGTALSSVINFFLTSQGQMSAVGTIVSAGYGFLCGAYMPIHSFGTGLQDVLCFLPGTYGTSMIRNAAMGGTFREMVSLGWPQDVVEGIKDSIDCNLYFFGNKVELGVMYLITVVSISVCIAAYVLCNVFISKKRK